MVMTMTPEQILVIANEPTTPSFAFGSQELADWNAKHCHRGECHSHSGWYVVVHQSFNPRQPTFRVLSLWAWGNRMPNNPRRAPIERRGGLIEG